MSTDTDELEIVKAALRSWANSTDNTKQVLTIPGLLEFIHGPAVPGKRRIPGAGSIRAWCNSGDIPARKAGLSWTFAVPAIQRWLANGMQS